jgi:hypothetical protein
MWTRSPAPAVRSVFRALCRWFSSVVRAEAIVQAWDRDEPDQAGTLRVEATKSKLRDARGHCAAAGTSARLVKGSRASTPTFAGVYVAAPSIGGGGLRMPPGPFK